MKQVCILMSYVLFQTYQIYEMKIDINLKTLLIVILFLPKKMGFVFMCVCVWYTNNTL